LRWTRRHPDDAGADVELNEAALPAIGDGGVEVPGYDRAAVRRSIVHLGVGGFHRSHLATYIDDLCRAGATDWGIVGTGVLPGDAAMAAALRPQDHLYTLIVRDDDHTRLRVVGSLLDYVHGHPDAVPLVDRLADPDVAIVSLTVTEAGYPVDHDGAFDDQSPNAAAGSGFDVLVRGLAPRRATGAPPVTVLSCDNVTGNGDVARTATLGVAQARDPDLAAWIAASTTFPNSMVDRITPATTDADREQLSAEHGIHDRWPVVAEPFRQWVVEDRFAGQRLPLEDLDVIVTDDVRPYEACKLRLLNAGHTVLAYTARLAGHTRVDQVMAEGRFATLLGRFLHREAGPVVPDAPGIDLDSYIGSVVVRFANPAISDQVDRLCSDGTSKIPIFLLPTVRDQLAAGGPIDVAALTIAAWCHYLRGVDDDGRPIDIAPDHGLAEAVHHARTADDGGAFLDHTGVFGDLRQHDRLRQAVTGSLAAIESDGVRATVDRVLAGSAGTPLP
jgi:mannitol 2-dehydrogenase